MASFAQLKQQRGERHATQPSSRHAAASGASQPSDGPNHGVAVPSAAPVRSDAAAAGASATVTDAASAQPSDGVQNEAGGAAPGDRADAEIARHPELAAAGLEVRTTAGRGRGVYATRPIRAGTALLDVRPAVAVLSSDKLAAACSACARPLDRPLRCAACRVLHYCAAACQRADWAAHKKECAALKYWRAMARAAHPDRPASDTRWIVNEGVRALARLCWARRGARQATGSDPDWWDGVRGMESHRTRLSDQQRQELANRVMFLRHFLAAADSPAQPDRIDPADMRAYGFADDDELMDLGSAFTVNSFTLSQADLSPVGVATSPLLALVNHACAPNAVVVFPGGPSMRLVAIADIAPGDEVLTSYIDVSAPYRARQAELAERYGFACACALCAAFTPAAPDPRWCVQHPECGGRAAMPDLDGPAAACVCEQGHSFTVPTDVVRRLHATGADLLKAEETGSLDMSKAHETLPFLIAALAVHVPPSHATLLALNRLAVLVYGARSPSALHASRAANEAALSGARVVYPPGHPTLAVLLAERAKLLALDPDDLAAPAAAPVPRRITPAKAAATRAQLGAAVNAAREAVDALRTGFGPGGDLERDMRELRAGLEQELASLARV